MSPFHASINFSNSGSIGVEAPFHHIYERGTCGIFIALGKIRRQQVIGDDGQMQTRDLIRTTISLDERICDGLYSGKAFSLFQYLVENSDELEKVPDLGPELLAQLQLKTVAE